MAEVNVRAEGSVEIAAFQNQESGMWVGECGVLGITVEADNLDELHSLIGEAIALLLDDLITDGDADAFFKARGWSEEPEWLPNNFQDDNSAAVVPWNLIAHGESHAPQQAVA